LTVVVKVHRVCWGELTHMQLPYGSPRASSRQSSLLYCIRVPPVTLPAANNNVTLLILTFSLTLNLSRLLVTQHETETIQFH